MNEHDLFLKLTKAVKALMDCPICVCGDYHTGDEFDHYKNVKGLLKQAEECLKANDRSKAAS